jgi:Cupin domain
VGRASAELIALVGARVLGEHLHPALVEKITVLEGQLTVKRDGQTSILHQGETAVIEAGVWHDWWNAGEGDARVRVEITPGERFVHMIETFFGLARLGHTDAKGMPNPLQLALSAREFSDVIVFRSPPLAVQRAIFGALAPIARWRGYRATYPQLSRIVLAPRSLTKWFERTWCSTRRTQETKTWLFQNNGTENSAKAFRFLNTGYFFVYSGKLKASSRK